MLCDGQCGSLRGLAHAALLPKLRPGDVLVMDICAPIMTLVSAVVSRRGIPRPLSAPYSPTSID